MRFKHQTIQAPNRNQEIDWARRTRDYRSFGEQIGDVLMQVMVAALVYAGAAMLCVIKPGLVAFLLPAGWVYSLVLRNVHYHLPFRLPSTANALDWGDTDIKGRPSKARGIAYLGVDRETGEELWLDDSSLRTHAAIFGTTGSGKTEFLLSIITNALCWSSGFIYSDGKADSALWAKVSSLAKRFGRDDDIRLLSYLIGRTSGYSNTMNFLADGAADVLTNLFTGLMGEAGAGNDMWKDRAISLVGLVMRTCVSFRDKGLLLLNVSTLRQFMSLDVVTKLALSQTIEAGTPGTPSYIHIENYELDPVAKESIDSFLRDLPGFDMAKAKAGRSQSDDANKQFSFCTMQLTKILNTLADTYQFIFSAPLGEIDMEDIVLNRRILIVKLPSLEKSTDETESLGKIVVATLKGMMGNTLMTRAGLEGTYADVIDNKATNAESPYIAVLDEIGYYCVRGLAVQYAQARSLGFSMIIGGQDKESMQQKGGPIEKDVAAMLANANLKGSGKLEDPGSTLELFNKIAGETTISEMAGMSADPNGLTNTYYDRQDASLSKKSRIEFLDLVRQKSGQFHLFFAGNIVRANVFYANPPRLPYLERRKFIMVRTPLVEAMEANMTIITNAVNFFEHGLGMRDLGLKKPDVDPCLLQLAKVFVAIKNQPQVRALGQACAVIASFVSPSAGNVERRSGTSAAGGNGVALLPKDGQVGGTGTERLMSPVESPLEDAPVNGAGADDAVVVARPEADAVDASGGHSSPMIDGASSPIGAYDDDGMPPFPVDSIVTEAPVHRAEVPTDAKSALDESTGGAKEERIQVVEDALARGADVANVAQIANEWRQGGESGTTRDDELDVGELESDLEALTEYVRTEGAQATEALVNDVVSVVAAEHLNRDIQRIETAVGTESPEEEARHSIAAMDGASQRLPKHPPQPHPPSINEDAFKNVVANLIKNVSSSRKSPASPGRDGINAKEKN